jgi:hypothetical protein
VIAMAEVAGRRGAKNGPLMLVALAAPASL